MTDVEAIAGESFAIATPSCIRGLEAGVRESGPRDSYEALTALEGKRSFLVAWGDRVVLHVKRPANTSQLKLSLRSLLWSSFDGPLVEVLVLGGTRIESQTPAIPFTDDGLPPAGATLLLTEAFAAEAQELSFALTDEGEDVLISVEAPCAEGSWSFSVGAWLDDLRFE